MLSLLFQVDVVLVLVSHVMDDCSVVTIADPKMVKRLTLIVDLTSVPQEGI